jgi:serine/threonine protein kinase
MAETLYNAGDKIAGRYLIHQVLSGGVGEVYLCLDLEEDKTYALKTIQQQFLVSPNLREVFRKEVETWVALGRHPNIVHCHGMELLDNRPFMFLEWITGSQNLRADLRCWLYRGPLSLRVAVDFITDVCWGFIHANQKQPGLVHCDIKPENILVNNWNMPVAKITDFGLTRICKDVGLEIKNVIPETNRRQNLILDDGIAGTPLYMAPEQWLEDDLDQRTDIYAVGCVLYELLVGVPPFRATSIKDLRKLHLEANVPIVPRRSGLPDALNAIIAKCLAKQKEERFATFGELLYQLSKTYCQQFSMPPRLALSHDKTCDKAVAKYIETFGVSAVVIDGTKEEYLKPAHYVEYQDTLSEAKTYILVKHYEKALGTIARAIEICPEIAFAHALRGLVEAHLGRQGDALAHYDRAIQLDPDLAWVYTNRSNTYLTLQCYDEALADLNRAIDLDPADACAYNNRGYLHSQLQCFDKALRDLNRSIQLEPNYALAYTNRGYTHACLEKYDQALSDYTYAIKYDPASAKAYAGRGAIYAILKECEKALADFNKAVRVDPTLSEAYFNIGVIHLQLKKFREALSNFEKAAQLGLHKAAELVEMIKLS